MSIIVPDSFTPISNNAVRIQPLQFTTFSEGRLINTDILSSAGNSTIPNNVSTNAVLFNNGTALNSPINMGLFVDINSTIDSILTGLPPIILALTLLTSTALTLVPVTFPIGNPMQALNDMNELYNKLLMNPIGQIEKQLNNLLTNLPTIAGMLTMSNKLASQCSMPISVSPCVALDLIIGGAIAALIVELGSLISTIGGLVVSGIAAIGTGLRAALVSLNTLLANITSAINTVLNYINSAFNVFSALSNAAILELMIIEQDLACIINLFSPQLIANLGI